MSHLLSSYFQAHSIHGQITAYENAGWEQAAERGPLAVNKNPTDIIDKLLSARQKLSHHLTLLSEEEKKDLSKLTEIHTASGRLRGILYQQALTEDEQAILATQRKIFERNWEDPNCIIAFTLLSYYYQPFELPIMRNISSLDWNSASRYLHFVMRQPHLMHETDDKRYIDHYISLTDWILTLIVEMENHPEYPKFLKLVEYTLTFGACYYVDCPTLEIVKARTKIVSALTSRQPAFKNLRTSLPLSTPAEARQKLRLGIVSRNSGDYTDTRALYAMFHSFDPERYEIYWYSLDIVDPTSLSDVNFFRKLYNFTHKIVSLRGIGAVMAQQILDDDLDILAVGTAYSFGAQALDQMLSQRLARVQVGLNAVLPGSQGFSSYDYLITSYADKNSLQGYQADCQEKVLALFDPLVWYEKRPVTKPLDSITREKLGIPEDAIVYCSGAAANKQMPVTLRTWLQVLRHVPNSYFLFYPFNPAWGGYFIGLTFLARLRAILKDYPDIDPSRVIVVRQVTPEEGDCLIGLSDIYLGSFPHGGATSIVLALRHGKPAVARKSYWLRSTSDPSQLRSMGLDELIGDTNEAATAIAVRLGLDHSYRQHIETIIAKRIEDAAFFDIDGNSKKLQNAFDTLALKHNLITPSYASSRTG